MFRRLALPSTSLDFVPLKNRRKKKFKLSLLILLSMHCMQYRCEIPLPAPRLTQVPAVAQLSSITPADALARLAIPQPSSKGRDVKIKVCVQILYSRVLLVVMGRETDAARCDGPSLKLLARCVWSE